MTDPTRLMDPATVAAAVGVPVGTIYAWRSKKRLTPVDVLPDGTALYDVDEVRALAKRTHRRPNRARARQESTP